MRRKLRHVGGRDATPFIEPIGASSTCACVYRTVCVYYKAVCPVAGPHMVRVGGMWAERALVRRKLPPHGFQLDDHL